MREKNTELVESLHQFIAISKLIGKPFPQVDGTDRRDWRSVGCEARCLYTARHGTQRGWHHHESDPGRLGKGRCFSDASRPLA
jgi:hypothetical protein